MNFKMLALSVSALALAATTFLVPAQAANDPIYNPTYNPTTAVTVSGVISAVSIVPGGQVLEGVHVTIRNGSGSVQVYLGPRDFLSFLKTNFAVGDGIDVMGSRVKAGSADVILAREVSDGRATLMLRDPNGAEVWKNWGAVTAIKST